MNKNELKAHMARYGDNSTTLAKAMGVAQSTLSYKINGRNAFDQTEIQFIVDRYSLTGEDIKTIFFTPDVSITET